MAALPISDRPDASLVREVIAGRTEAFNVLVRRWERKIYTYIVHLTNRPEDAFDLCQEVFVSAYRNLNQLRSPETFRPWLFRIAHNLVCSQGRRLSPPMADLQEADSAPRPSTWRGAEGSTWAAGEIKLLVERALGELPLEQREAIILKVYQGMKFAEIAEIQGCPLSTVKTRVYGGFEQLKKLMES